MYVWSGVRREPAFTPNVATSLKLSAKAALSSFAQGRGKAGWNWALLVSANGVVKGRLPGDMLVAVADSHWPMTAPAPLKAGTGALKPSVARHARTWVATLSPQAMPRATLAASSRANSARDRARWLSKRLSC